MPNLNAKTVAKGILFLVLFTIAAFAGTKNIYTLDPASDNFLCLDAVNYTYNLGGLVADSETVGSANYTYMWPAYDENPNTFIPSEGSHLHGSRGSRATYMINVASACSVQIYALMYFYSGTHNSMYISIDEDSTYMYGQTGASFAQWQWLKRSCPMETTWTKAAAGGSPVYEYDTENPPENYYSPYIEKKHYLAAGIHSIHLSVREAGSKVSQILLRVNDATSPTPPEDLYDMDSLGLDTTDGARWATVASPSYAFDYGTIPVAAPTGITIWGEKDTASQGLFTVPGGSQGGVGRCDSVVISFTKPGDVSNIVGYIFHVEADSGKRLWPAGFWESHSLGYNQYYWIREEDDVTAFTIPFFMLYGTINVNAYSFNGVGELSDSAFGTVSVESFDVGILDQPMRQLTRNTINMTVPGVVRGTANIQYALPMDDAKLHSGVSIYNLQGKLVRALSGNHNGGNQYNAVWNGKTATGSSAASGRYIAQVKAGEKTAQKSFILVK